MNFKCDRCGAVYSTRQELREGRVYQARCQSCGNSIRLTMASRPPIAVPRPRPPVPEVRSPADPAVATRAARGAGEPTPPPADGYYDLVLDDSQPQNPMDSSPAAVAQDPPLRDPEPQMGSESQARILAPAGKPASRRRLGVVALVAIAAGVVLFGAVGAMALKRPHREEERVSRALLPRAEWVESRSGGAVPSPEILAQLEAEADEPPADTGAPAAPRRGDRPAARPAPRPVAAAPAASPAPAERQEPAPAPPPAPEPPPAAAPPAVQPPVPAVRAPAEQTEDAPQFARQGFRSPAQEIPGCVQSSVRIPRDLQGFASGPITVRFAVDRDGSVGLFRVEGQVPDRRISEAIWSAVRECRFVPGADERGQPVRLWVVMPIRFVR